MFGSILALMQCFVFYESYFKFYASIRKRTKFELIFNPFTISFVILALIGTYVHQDTAANFKVPQFWVDNIIKNCKFESKANSIDIDPESANYEKFYLSYGIIGLYIGVMIDQKYYKDKHIFFNETDFVTSVKRVIITGLLGSPIALPLIFITKKNSGYWAVMIGR